MAQLIDERLFQAVKNDDIKAFNELMEKAQCGAYRLGRFPVLSLLYLYKSRKIIRAYEEKFLKITAYEVLREPVEVSRKFSQKAGKCLRLYLNEVVSPLEMLLILDKTMRLRRIYPLTKPSAAVKARLKSIYSIKYSLTVKFEGNAIVLDRRPLSYREKKNIATVCLCTVAAVAIAVGVPVTVNAVVPKPVEGEVTKLSQIDFTSGKEYKLKRDIVVPENYSVRRVNCTIVGEGNKLVLGEGASLGELNGKLSDVIIESSGAVFTSVNESATLENVTVNVAAALTATEQTALVAETNYGVIDGVTLSVSGKIAANAVAGATTTELSFGGIVQTNGYKYNAATNVGYRGVVRNCTVNYSDLELVGELTANAAFGGVVGVNDGYVEDCTVSGSIVADTFDIAGVCLTNNGALTGNVNTASLAQTSDETGWNPIVCGIVLSNANNVENCVNSGKISTASTSGKVDTDNETIASAAGIAYLNRGTSYVPYLSGCVNEGAIECRAANRNAYAAGICISTSGRTQNCRNGGELSAQAENGFGVFVGGIAALTYGDIYLSVNEGAIDAVASGDGVVGGISAQSCAQLINCVSDGDISVTAQKVFAGGVLGFSEVLRSGFYVYCGTVADSISRCAICVTVVGDEPARVGGIVGCMSELGLYSDNELVYFGGSVVNCYYTGECDIESEYFGSIIGVCGVNIYENNSYSSGGEEYRNFEDNVYSGASPAFGATENADGEFAAAEDKGASKATVGEIENSDGYKTILNNLTK